MKERAEAAQAYFINGLAKVESEATKRNPLSCGELELNENIRVMLAYIAALEAEVAGMTFVKKQILSIMKTYDEQMERFGYVDTLSGLNTLAMCSVCSKIGEPPSPVRTGRGLCRERPTETRRRGYNSCCVHHSALR